MKNKQINNNNHINFKKKKLNNLYSNYYQNQRSAKKQIKMYLLFFSIQSCKERVLKGTVASNRLFSGN